MQEHSWPVAWKRLALEPHPLAPSLPESGSGEQHIAKKERVRRLRELASTI